MSQNFRNLITFPKLADSLRKSRDSLARGISGVQMKYSCYVLQIEVLKNFIKFWWGDIRV
jgi:hypothetical protein